MKLCVVRGEEIVPYLSVYPRRGELRLGHHHADPEDGHDERVVADPPPLLEERLPPPEPVPDAGPRGRRGAPASPPAAGPRRPRGRTALDLLRRGQVDRARSHIFEAADGAVHADGRPRPGASGHPRPTEGGPHEARGHPYRRRGGIGVTSPADGLFVFDGALMVRMRRRTTDEGIFVASAGGGIPSSVWVGGCWDWETGVCWKGAKPSGMVAKNIDVL
ncbi:hypothetical protein JTE90_002597 [Oedothorax gibbosus]|uniref:Uncharacterized protein n=1 Tax=Oedothorax gibbosus TaxID=931172 RepID=A0AAV6V2P4_9ARAC|nr:hypothetical protein JTE90_002597 [Oedothorax gibbosus]